MLKALELNGFKSFADPTRIEFPPGITVIVGPNGSGKSNIVDAMKWVLGEQSARSLRGKEMADVIYKGAGSGKRKPAGSAEATIIFDNTDDIFGMESDEIRVTRRVYRSGEGEYLINNQPCRLRDIKDMFRGTGVGTDAYSLIEQGKVDSLLQAAPRDRRAIFEEAAGISRFKAKKIESQRRLERVEQNLLRLSDIVDEVDNRLRRLKSQAGKARRYKEYSDRLQELRTQVGRVDWEDLTTQLTVVDAEVVTLTAQAEQIGAELQAAEARSFELETEISQLDDQLRDWQSRSGRTREKIAARQSTVDHERSRLADFDEEIDRYQRHLLAMMSRAGDLQTEWKNSAEELAAAEEDYHSKVAEADRRQADLDAATEQLDQSRTAAERRRSDYVERMRLASNLNQQIATHQSLINSAAALMKKVAGQISVVESSVEAARDASEQLAERLTAAESAHIAADADLTEARATADSLREKHTSTEQELIDLRQRRAVIGERVALLEDIEKRMEGIGSGVKKMLGLAKSDPDGPLSAIRGMVADLIEVRERNDAEMVAVALGERAQHLVIAGNSLVDHLARGELKAPGRVGFVRLQSTPPPQFLRAVDLHDQPGVIGRADHFVETETEYQHLAEWLLGDTWFVETLEDAVQFHRSLKAPPRFVTRSGESLDRDGRLLVGPNSLELGLISRRAELAALKEDTSQLERQVKQQTSALAKLAERLTESDQRLVQLTSQQDASFRELAELRLRSKSAAAKLAELQQRHGDLSAEFKVVEDDSLAATSQLTSSEMELDTIQTAIATLESALAGDQQQLMGLESSVKDLGAQATSAKVTMARSEQRVDALRTRRDQLQRDQDERESALQDVRSQMARAQLRSLQSERDILSASAEVSLLCLDDQQATASSRALSTERESFQSQRAKENEVVVRLRDDLRKLDQRRHTHEMDAERLRHERTALADRLREDYQIDVASLQGEMSFAEEQARAEVDVEITELRRKITNIGSVNMDALEELTDLESRHTSLVAQYDDLVEAKETLERIINKINADSRRLFTETLEAIRVNFQVLFRKVFGGGTADIVLEQDVDILESGIDIVATPPGKHSLRLSLLSGGERALTAVTLLLAIFEYRPSPFCVLDEVDGPLDEANIGRFIEVLREFLKWTKFVVVTHSKKTMTAANTLYGITMQESGVSKRVSVRFEDVSDDGEISQSAVQRAASSDPDDDDERGAA